MASRSLLPVLLGSLASCGGASPAPTAPTAVTEGTVASADGVPIYCRSAGAGEPTVVLVHCWACSSDEWADTMTALAPTHHVVALDLAGHGRSGKGRTAWTTAAFAGDIRAVLAHLGVARAIVVGHSMAGAIAIEAAVEMPDQVVGVIPIDTLQDAGTADDPDEITAFAAQLRASFAPTVEALIRRIMPRTADPAVIQRILGFELANDPAIAVEILETNWRFPVKDVIPRVKVPIIAISGDVLPVNVAGNQALAPQYQLHVIQGVGHWPMLEAPQRFHALLLQAVAEITATAPK